MEPRIESRTPEVSRRTFLGAAGSLGAAGVLYGVTAGNAGTANASTGQTAGTASLQVYPVPSIYPASTDYTMTVNGVSVPIQKFAGYDIAQLGMGPGTATVALKKINNTNIGSWSLSPQRLGISATASGSTLHFTLPSDGYYIVKVDGRPQLVLAFDPAQNDQPPSSGDGVFNVTAPPYNARPGTSGYSTQAFTSALADASSWGTSNAGQGTVYVPAGVYNVGNLVLLSNTALYLEPGAVLRYTGERAFYVVNAHKDSQNRDLTWLVRTDYHSSNIRLYGRGIIDGNGMASLGPGNLGVNLLAPVWVNTFSCDGITFRESSSWNVIPIRSSNLTFTNIKIFNRFDMGEDDGIDVMESTNVNVTHAIAIGLDDNFSTKTWTQGTDILSLVPGQPQPLDRVTFTDLVCWTYCYAVKVGQGVQQPQSNVTFSQVVVYDAAVAVGIDHKYGTAAASTITFRDIDVERLDFNNAGNQCWLALMTEDAGVGVGPTRDVTILNVRLRAPDKTASRITGLSNGTISNVKLQNIIPPGASTPATTLAAAHITNVSNASSVTITT
ncbi:MAG TPA: glycosyl hydrolase family 28 protein [Actinocrinis sp.]|jgi:hypothetical protein|uniref:glycosyl hydrolase family 28 protein n=1 Tax=Actinocrinis sp. TaxID=1920516 RepID=UPI002DDC9C81|nr:glycosyl hydrolase family 28 protein [Actinocrinis sp.]HEV3170256.1 glycosyl hydrolase family 28 protein [Actinocrinis sp.]